MHRNYWCLSALMMALLGGGCGRVAVGTPDAGAGGSSGTGGGGAGGGAGGTGGSGGGGGTGGQAGGCAFGATYKITDGGGLVPQLDTATLTPPSAFSYDRRSFVSDAGQPSCAPALPACHDATLVDVSDVEAAIAHPDVQSALAQAMPPTYGQRNIADGPNFSFMRGDSHGFNNGLECSPASATCTPTPPGVHALMVLLRRLIDQQLANPACAGFRN